MCQPLSFCTSIILCLEVKIVGFCSFVTGFDVLAKKKKKERKKPTEDHEEKKPKSLFPYSGKKGSDSCS